jgi:HD-GYP domain-containing protein (c-di-GMP phosphodiesterase class II)
VTEEIRTGAGSQFDPELATAFLDLDLTRYDQMLAGHVAQDTEAS